MLAPTLWVMGFFHSLFGNGTYDILPEQSSMGEELLPEQSSMEEGSSLCLGAELYKGRCQGTTPDHTTLEPPFPGLPLLSSSPHMPSAFLYIFQVYTQLRACV